MLWTCPACRRSVDHPLRRNICDGCHETQEALDTFFASGAAYHGGQGRTAEEVERTGFASLLLMGVALVAIVFGVIWALSR